MDTAVPIRSAESNLARSYRHHTGGRQLSRGRLDPGGWPKPERLAVATGSDQPPDDSPELDDLVTPPGWTTVFSVLGPDSPLFG